MRLCLTPCRRLVIVGLSLATLTLSVLTGAQNTLREERPPLRFELPKSLTNPPAPKVQPPPALRRNRDGKRVPLQTYSDTTHTRPNRAAKQKRAAEPDFVHNQVLGEQGVQQTAPQPTPFGSKGEYVALAFGSGEYLPPAGERIQPTLHRLAQQRFAVRNPQDNAAAPAVYGLILLNGKIDAALRRNLTEAGVELLGFYPHTAYMARIPASALEQVAALPQVRWIGQPNRTQKLDPDLGHALRTGNVNPLALRPENRRPDLFPVYLALFGPDKDEAIRNAIRAEGGIVNRYSPGIRVVQADMDAATLERVLMMDAVLYAELVEVQHALHTQSMASINADRLWGQYDPLPTGSTAQVRVGIMDSGVYTSHGDFENVDTGTIGFGFIDGESVFTDLNGHGTHVAGTMVGEGLQNYRYRGIAAGLKDTNNTNPDFLVAQVFNQYGDAVGTSVLEGLEYMNGELIANRIRQVFNYSGGGTGANMAGTDTNSRKVDEIFANNVVAVIAAGNSGSGAATINRPGVAKGAITVGNIYNNDIADGLNGLVDGLTDAIANTSSRGPTTDNRIKPDVVAPGRYIDSIARGTSNGYAYDWSGTSMAAPHVAGLVAGLIGHYQGDGMPAWAYKAVLIASAVDIGLASSAQGRGKVDAYLAHYSSDGGWQANWSSISADNELDYYDFTLNQAASQVKIALVWPDPPAAEGAAVAIVNDLDLGVQTSGALNNSWASKNYSSVTSRDSVEVVTINNLAAGTYRIKIYGYNVTDAPQRYAICRKVIYGDVDPNITLDFETPYAVQPNTSFYAKGFATAESHVASGVYADIEMLVSGMTVNGLWYNRRSKPSSSDEWAYFDSPDPDTAGWYNPLGMNMGNISFNQTREIWWSVRAGATEGTKTIRFDTRSSNGGSGSNSNSVIVDGTPPSSTAIRNMHWFASLNPDVVWSVRDIRSGLDVSTGEYRYSTNGGTTWSAWAASPSTGSDGTTLGQSITVNNVPFGQNSNNNRIQFRIDDMAGNSLTSTFTITTPTPTSLTLTPNKVPMGDPANGRVTLSGVAPTDGALVYLESSNPAVASVPATVTVDAGDTQSPYFVINTSNVLADTNVTISATYGGVTRNAVLKVQRPITVSGTITLEDVVDSVQNVTFTFRPLDGAPNFNRNVVLNAAGGYSLSNIPARQYTVHIKGAKWLAKNIALNATAGNVNNANGLLLAGDANNDNSADVLDLDELIQSFDKCLGDTGFINGADLNCDGCTDVLDLDLLLRNFDVAGDL